MSTRPKPAELSEHAKIMQAIFSWLEGWKIEGAIPILPIEFFSDKYGEVLAAVYAFADEQVESA